MSGPENRKSRRFFGKVPVEFKNGIGTTRDYSIDGVYFTTDQPVAVGEQIEFVMVLNHQGTNRTVRLQCVADVVRIEQDDEQTGTAAAINQHMFLGIDRQREATSQ